MSDVSSNAEVLTESLLRRTAELARADGEFSLASARWLGDLVLVCGKMSLRLAVTRGAAAIATEARPGGDDVVIEADREVWEAILVRDPPPRRNDFFAAVRDGVMTVTPTIERYDIHVSVRRICDLMRFAANGADATPQAAEANLRHHGEFEAAVGRYVHLDLLGVDYRIYFEEAGAGIPLLCQHTAGGDARQWRHLLEDEAVTSRFRVIAYDLPFHGRSLPAASSAWWAQEYKLTTAFAMAVPLGLSEVLNLTRPVFLGVSIGGMLALDLVRYHPDAFRAVIAVQGGLRAAGGLTPAGVERIARLRGVERLLDPALQGSRMMSAMSPNAPEARRQETALGYAQSAPGVYAGDLYFHALDHDLRGEAEAIDASRCAVRMLTGEYDFTMVPISERAASEIKGATLQIMEGLGHFPHSEDPDRFMHYLAPILDEFTDS